MLIYQRVSHDPISWRDSASSACSIRLQCYLNGSYNGSTGKGRTFDQKGLASWNSEICWRIMLENTTKQGRNCLKVAVFYLLASFAMWLHHGFWSEETSNARCETRGLTFCEMSHCLILLFPMSILPWSGHPVFFLRFYVARPFYTTLVCDFIAKTCWLSTLCSPIVWPFQFIPGYLVQTRPQST